MTETAFQISQHKISSQEWKTSEQNCVDHCNLSINETYFTATSAYKLMYTCI
jgi:hypothetical protein